MDVLISEIKDSNRKWINKTAIIPKEMKICVKLQIMQAKKWVTMIYIFQINLLLLLNHDLHLWNYFTSVILYADC